MSQRNKVSRKVLAFTLIELLIVVAIIAILAAIAVPNFLDAQTRAKVVRTINDMRAVGIAIESYVVDYNEPPQAGTWTGGKVHVNSTGFIMIERFPASSANWMGLRLTTPISYISSIPWDEWNSMMIRKTDHSQWGRNRRMSFLGQYVPHGGSSGGRENYTFKTWWEGFIGSQGYTYPKGDMYYVLASAGPDLRWWTGKPDSVSEFFYDPTNGTISPGDLWRTSNAGNIPSLSR